MAEETVTTGSGNVFKDLDCPNPYYIQFKADLIMAIQDFVKAGDKKPKDLGVSKVVFNRITSYKGREHDMLDIYTLIKILDDNGYNVLASIIKR